MSSRKRKSNDKSDEPAKKKPKLDSFYTRTDPITGNLGRMHKKDEEYYRNYTRRAMKKREMRMKRKAKEEAKKAAAKKQRRLSNEKAKKEKEKAKEKEVVSSEYESSDNDEKSVEDTNNLEPFHSMTKRFTDHVCVVTGAGRGIGQSIAIRLAREGAIIYVLDNKRWKDTVDEITEIQKKLHKDAYTEAMALYNAKKNGKKPKKTRFRARCFHKQCDVTDVKKTKDVIDEIVNERGYIDVVVNCLNAKGKNYGKTASTEVKLESFDKIMRLNLYSTVNVCNAVIPYMIKEKYGRIVNLASVDGKNGCKQGAAYACSKAAVINLTKTLGQEYGGTGITINCVAPQYDEYHTKKFGMEQEATKVPMGRSVNMDELSGCIAFICSEENTYTTGFCYDISGGMSTY